MTEVTICLRKFPPAGKSGCKSCFRICTCMGQMRIKRSCFLKTKRVHCLYIRSIFLCPKNNGAKIHFTGGRGILRRARQGRLPGGGPEGAGRLRDAGMLDGEIPKNRWRPCSRGQNRPNKVRFLPPAVFRDGSRFCRISRPVSRKPAAALRPPVRRREASPVWPDAKSRSCP